MIIEEVTIRKNGESQMRYDKAGLWGKWIAFSTANSSKANIFSQKEQYFGYWKINNTQNLKLRVVTSFSRDSLRVKHSNSKFSRNNDIEKSSFYKNIGSFKSQESIKKSENNTSHTLF